MADLLTTSFNIKTSYLKKKSKWRRIWPLNSVADLLATLFKVEPSNFSKILLLWIAKRVFFKSLNFHFLLNYCPLKIFYIYSLQIGSVILPIPFNLQIWHRCSMGEYLKKKLTFLKIWKKFKIAAHMAAKGVWQLSWPYRST